MEWMMEEGAMDPELAFVGYSGTRAREGKRKALRSRLEEGENLAVFLKPMVVQNTRKWFGDASLRLDSIVTHGGAGDATLFHPRTIRFPRVSDGDDLCEQDENGLMVFYGRPEHFLVISIMLSRDTKDSDDLATLIRNNSRDGAGLALLSGLVVNALHAAAVQSAITAALGLADFAYSLLRVLSPKTLGLYRANWLSEKDGFGVGRHPEVGTYPVRDFELGYQVVVNRAQASQ